ncbi:TlpA family protein disulfide reductase [Pedobacter insulae]|uniref:Thiol-disulfide isomerase or thioredoxin n=1 Tax=Pedobacter insulae TaxID=414048 RepID=A0A1I2VR47_9SPHI|nr:TlpA disulfide reductase family protein [Pedobacter insulae]SFG89661.1 Thiol-disulfide isomerase or thioredoxin [Pedobacter insulae]
MKKPIIVMVALIVLFVGACIRMPEPQNENKTVDAGPKIDSSKIGQPIIIETDIMKDFNSFWSYYKSEIKFFEDFVAFDTSGMEMSKGDFLKTLSSGDYYPLNIYSKDSLINYKLAKIPAKSPEYAGAYIRQDSRNALVHFKMEGKPIPAFNFTDIDGKLYSSENTKGKIVLFKCWFINCPACILEMPALNKMVQKYKGRDDILFVSLAIDPKEPLQTFLKKTQFDYSTVPNQKKYMDEQLKVFAYPHHFLINKKGILVKSVDEAPDIEMILERELAK